MVLLPKEDQGHDAWDADIHRESDEGARGNEVEVRSGQRRGEIQQRDRQRDDADELMGEVPGVLIHHRPGQAQACVPLEGEARAAEVARIFSTDRVTDLMLQTARSMLEEGKRKLGQGA